MKTNLLRFKLSVLIVLALFAANGNWFERVTHGQQESRIEFNRDIKPILSDNCFVCHGPDGPAKKIKLRLDSESAALAELGKGRRAIVPGHPEQSELVRRITAADEFERMPPVSSGHKLSPREIQLLTEWIKQGAKWQQHWAFIAPTSPRLPSVKNKTWPKNPIDYFVLAKLESQNLQPSPETDRATLLRRVSFDLTGLPPTLKELDDFLNDKTPNAYEKAVDRLLASPAYGERMAFKWLDAARYADTNGYQIDGERSMWRWRDWVINAFNRNLPFDQFTIEQLAGDLLPPASGPAAALDQRIATAFNRNHRTNAEDGLIPEEYRIEYVVDRVDTTSAIFLGLTMGCARCHNHKYDPLTQREYYQFSAYFNSIPEDGRASNYGNSAPWISAPTREQQRQLKQIESGIARSQRQLASLTNTHTAAQQRWERSLDSTKNVQWFPGDNLLVRHAMDASAMLSVNGSIAKINLARPDDTKNSVKGAVKEEMRDGKPSEKKEETGFKNGLPKFISAPTGEAAAFDGKLFFDAGKTANFDYRDRLKDYKDNFAVSAWFYPESEQSGAIVTHMKDEAGESENNLPKGRGWGVFFNNGKINFNLISVWADDSYRVETEEKLPLRQWHHVVAAFDSSAPLDKVKIYINGREAKLKINLGRIFRSFGDDKVTLKFGAGGGPAWRFNGALDEVRIYKAIPEEEQIAVLACADPLDAIAKLPATQRTRAQQLKIQNAFWEIAAPAVVQTAWKQLAELKQQKLKLEAEFPTLMVMQETVEPRPAYLLRRGAYDAPAEKVERAVPAVLPVMSPQLPVNRLGLAKWLVNDENPLTSRVQVNRYWQMLFGTGLVKTVEDFGSQGELPSHPELLDWLAVAFRDGISDFGLRNADLKKVDFAANPQSAIHNSQSKAWNVKALLKLMVTSATYRQSSKLNPQSADPENRLLSRVPRVRLSAEMIRDQALLASGLLVERLGGASVKPYQPDGLWKDMTFSNMTNYDQAKGDGLWRRSLYTFWKRTVLNPGMLVFDSSAREFCTVREVRTNTPLQALNLMNDVTFIEAARMLAQRTMLEGQNSLPQRLVWMFRTVISRQPNEREQQLLLNSFQAQLSHFRRNPKDAENLLAIGEKRSDGKLNSAELAAYATVASLILNLDEAITKQ